MFVLTVNKKRIGRVLAAIACVVAIGAAAVGAKSFVFRDADVSAKPKKLKLQTTMEMVEYISDKGFCADVQTAQVMEVEIPKKFDENFVGFNEKIKETDGMSLEKYKGDKVNKWTFDIIDYGKGENEEKGGKDSKKAVAVLLVKRERLVGAYILEQPQGIARAMSKENKQAAL
ncbi:MAG: DUF4830 domain-containing protein [Oscillospiraceae bacterium]